MVCSTADPVHVKVQEIHKYGPVRVAVPNQSPHPSFLSAKRSYYLCVSEPKSGMLQIEWKSSLYHSDGRRRSRPKASTVHGWLVKWRATFSGNERLRKEGIREMREAKAVREWKKQRKAARQAKAKERGQQTPKRPSRVSQHSSAKRPSCRSTRHLTSPTHSPLAGPTPANSRRSSHNRQGTDNRTPHSSRKASHNIRRDIVRTAEKKR